MQTRVKRTSCIFLVSLMGGLQRIRPKQCPCNSSSNSGPSGARCSRSSWCASTALGRQWQPFFDLLGTGLSLQ